MLTRMRTLKWTWRSSWLLASGWSRSGACGGAAHWARPCMVDGHQPWRKSSARHIMGTRMLVRVRARGPRGVHGWRGDDGNCKRSEPCTHAPAALSTRHATCLLAATCLPPAPAQSNRRAAVARAGTPCLHASMGLPAKDAGLPKTMRAGVSSSAYLGCEARGCTAQAVAGNACVHGRLTTR